MATESEMNSRLQLDPVRFGSIRFLKGLVLAWLDLVGAVVGVCLVCCGLFG